MAPPKKKGVTMDLTDFIGDWAEEDTGPTTQWNQSTDLFASVGMTAPAVQEQKIPNLPPFTARLGNLSYEADEADIRRFFNAQKVSEVRIPKNPEHKSKGYAFVEFFDRDSLISALALDSSSMNGRSVRVNLEQSSNDYGRRGGRYNDEPELNWGQRRAPQVAPREFRDAPEPENFDWSKRRAPSRAPEPMRMQRDREPRAFREEPELDWGQRRAPTRAPAPTRNAPTRTPRTFREEPELDWSKRQPTGQKKGLGKPSGFDVLKSTEDKEPAPAAAAPARAPAASKDTTKLADSIAAATSNADDDSWTTVKR